MAKPVLWRQALPRERADWLVYDPEKRRTVRLKIVKASAKVVLK